MNEPNVNAFLEKLEEIKRDLGSYAVMIRYGEEIGCDDFDTPALDRRLAVSWVPCGVGGGANVLYQGTVREFLEVDFTDASPAPVANRDQAKGPGFYVRGTEWAMKTLSERRHLGDWGKRKDEGR